MANRITYQVGFDIHKQGLNQLKSSLQQLSKMKVSDLMKINASDSQAARTQLNKIQKQAAKVEDALQKAFNTKLNTVNIETFNQQLKNSGTSIENIYQTFKKAGATGENAFRSLSSQVLNTNIQLKESHTLLDNMATTLANTVKWNVASSAVNSLSNSIQQAFGYVKDLDTSLNDIRIVTNKTAEDMGVFAEKANEVAQSLGKSTTDYTKAALIYAQQGLNDKQIEERAAITLKTANVTGQSTNAVSEELTAVWNGYKVNAQQAQLYVDRLAAVAATTASDLEELSTGMSKVASAAATMGVNEEQLAAQLSTIISVTREAPETIGTSLKTIYARISDIKAGIAEDGATLGNYSGKMAEFGINVLDANGNLRDMGVVMEEIGGKWDTLTREQQVYLAQTMAGQRQYSRLLALFDNWGQYTKALNTAQNAAGTLQKQQDIYMESTAAHLNTLKAAIDNIYDSFINTDSINSLVDGLTTVSNLMASFVDSVGGGGTILTSLGAIGVTVFSEQIAKGINTTITNFEKAKENANQFSQSLQAIKEWQGIPGLDKVSKDLLDNREKLLQLSRLMSPQQFQGMQTLLNDITKVGNEIASLSEKQTFLKAAIEQVLTYKDAWKSAEDVMASQEGQKAVLERLQKQENKFKQVSNELKKYIENLKSLNEGSFNFSKAKGDIEEYLLKIKDLAARGELGQHQKQIKNIEKELENLDDSLHEDILKAKLESITAQLKGMTQAAEQAGKNIKQEFGKNIEDAVDSYNVQLDRSNDDLKKKQAQFDATLSRMVRTETIENFSKLAGGIGQVGMSIQTVQNLGSIWKNEDLSTSEKILQTITNLAMTLPMFGSGLAAISNALGLVTIEVGEAGAAAITSEQAFEFLGMAISVNPLLAWVAGITAVVGALAIANNALKQHREEIIKNQKAIIEEQNQKQEQIRSHEQLYDSLEQLDEKYKDGQITRAELKSSVQNLVDQYELQKQAADNLKNSYLNLTDAIKEAKDEQEKELIQSTRREKNAAKRGFQESLKGEGGLDDLLFGDYTKITFGSGGASKKVQDQISKVFSSKGATVNANGVVTFEIDPSSETSLIQVYEKIQSVVDDLEKSGKIAQQDLDKATQYKRATEFLKEYSEQYKKLKDSVDEYNNTVNQARINHIAQDVDFQKIKDTNNYLKERTELIEKLKNSYRMTYEEAANVVDNYLKKNQDQIYNQFNEVASSLDKIKEKIGGEIPESVETLISKFNDQQLTEFFKLDTEDFQSWTDLENILTEISEKDFSNVKDIKSMRESAAQNFTYFSTLEDQVSSGKNISTKEFESLAERGAEQLQQFFDMAANGTYKMTGDAEQFYRLVDGFKLDGFFETLSAIQEKINAINEASQQFDLNDLKSSALTFGTDQNIAGPMVTGVDQEKLSEQIKYLEEAKTITEDQAEIWEKLIENHQADVDLCQQIADKVAQTEKQSGDLKEQWNQIADQIHDALVPLDSDIDTSELEHLTNLLLESEDAFMGVQEWAEDAAASILRFDDGITDVIDNYENWVEVLNSGNDVEYVRIAEDLADAYADILDLANNDMLSDTFLQSADNLELLNTAAGNTEGSLEQVEAAAEAAYDELMNLAYQDIEAHITINDDEFYTKRDQIRAALENWQAQGLSDLQVNANLQNEDFINSFNEMLQKTDAGVAEAQSLIQAMGFDAEVIQTDPQVIDTPTENQYWKPATYSVTNMSTGGEENQGSYGALMLDTPGQWISQQGNTQTVIPGTGAVQIKSLHKSTGGGIKFTKSSNGGGSVGTARRTAIANKKAEEAAQADEQGKKEAEKLQKQIQAENAKAERQAERQRKAEQREAEKQRKAQEKAQKQAQKAAEKAAKTAEQNVDTSTKDKKELIKDERDIYHNINIEIKQINRELQRTQEQQDKLYGKDLLNNLNKQTEILEKHKQKLKEKQQLQRYDLAQQKASLMALGATFDAYGNITNYMTVVAQKQNAVNKLVAQYNDLINTYNSSTDKDFKKNIDDQLTAVNKEIQSAEKDLKDAKDRISNYDSLREAIEDITDQVEEETQKEIEINIKKFRMQLQIRLDMREAEKDWNDFQRKVINHTDIIKDTDFSKIFKDAETGLQNILSYYQTESIETLTDQLLNTYSEIQLIDAGVGSAIYGNNEKQAMEDLKGDLKTLMGQLGDIQDLIDSIDQAYLNTIDDVQNQFNKQINDYDYITGLIDHNIDLLTLLYGNKNYDAMQKYYSTLQINQGKELEALKLQGEYWKKQWDEAEAQGDTKAAEKFEENYKNVINKTAQLVADAAKTIKNKFTTAIDEIFDNLEGKLTNGKNLNYLQMEWNLINKNADEYLDTVNAAFAVQQLEVKFKNALRDTDNKNVKAQKQIKTLMDEQLANLKAKQKLTQYDVDRAAKLLEIEQARIALEESKANKTTMRLKRDSQGNYSYEYVADQGSIEQAQQNLASAQNELYNFDKDRYRSNLEDMLSAYKDFSSKLKEIWEDDNLSYEKKVQMQSLLEEQYGEYINGKTQQNLNIRNNLTESAFKEIASIYQTDVSNYNQMSEDEKNILMGDLIPTWNSGIQQMSDKIAGQGGLIPACESAFVGISEATKEYEDDLKSLEKEAGIDLQNIKNGVDDLTTSFMELIANNEQLVQVAGGQLDAIKDLKDAAHDLTTEYNAVYSAALQAVSAMQTFMQEKQRQAAEEASQYSGGGSSGYTTTSTSSYDSSTSSGYQDSYDYSDDSYDSSGYNGDILSSENVEGIAGNIWVYGSWGNQPNRHKLMVEKFGQAAGDQLFAAVQSLINNDIQYNGVTSSWEYYKKFAPSSFRTGGYTGNWIGTEGKLGLLHQKEMVLNADDTKNLLDTISILRQMVNNITGGISARLNSVRSDSYSSNSNNDNLEQNVHIKASFPNVNSKREIEEAFNDLVNLAAQRAMRR